MKQLICEMCGGSEFTKSGGVFVCNRCNTKYDVVEAHKMLDTYSEAMNTAENKKIQNLIKAGMEELNAKNYAEAYDVFKSVLLLDADNAEATFYKGLSGAWNNSSDINTHFHEAVTAADKAMSKKLEQCKETGAYYDFVLEVLKRLHALAKSEINGYYLLTGKEMNDFAYAYDKTKDELMDAKLDGYTVVANSYQQQLTQLRAAIRAELPSLAQRASDIMALSCAFLAKTAGAVKDLTVLPLEFIQIMKTALSDYEALANKSLPSFTGRLKWAKEEVDQVFSEIKPRYSSNLYAVTTKIQTARETCKSLEGRRKMLAVEKYWQEHAEERKELEHKKAQFKEQIANENKKIEDIANKFGTERNAIQKEIDALSAELSAIGFFKFKDKKAVREKINAKETEKQTNISKQDAAADAIKLNIKTFEKRIADIDAELTKDR